MTSSSSAAAAVIAPRFIIVTSLVWLAALFFLLPGGTYLPAGSISSASFFIAQLILPGCRLSLRPLVTPLNWALAAFFVLLVLVPVDVRIAGPALFPLPSLPSDAAMNCSLLLSTLAFWAFCASLHWFRSSKPISASNGIRIKWRWIPGLRVVALCACVGLVGVALSFGSFERFIQYLTDPVGFVATKLDAAGDSATLGQAAGVFLSPFLGFAFVLLWCRSVDLPVTNGEWRRQLWRIALIALIALAYSLKSYNRGSFAVPMLTIIAVLGKRLPGSAKRYVLAAGLVFALLIGSATLYRTAAQGGRAAASPSVADAASYINLGNLFQLYGQAPQYLGYFLQRSQFGNNPHFGRTVLSSIMYPIPVLGRNFRPYSGTILYNTAMGREDFRDQVIQFEGELFIDFHVFGVILGFGLLGWAIAKLQSRFDASVSAVEIYIVQFAGIWIGFLTLGSIDVLAQIALFSSLPVYLCLFTRIRRKKRLRAWAHRFPALVLRLQTHNPDGGQH